MDTASKKETSCFSCRTVANNKKRIGTKSKEKNPAWRGYKDVPGKVFSKLKRGASQRDLEFSISIEDIYNQYEKQHKVCALSGLGISFDKDASVDRIDSNIGYTVDNIQIVHKKLNMLKKDTPDEEFIEWCCLVAKHSGV